MVPLNLVAIVALSFVVGRALHSAEFDEFGASLDSVLYRAGDVHSVEKPYDDLIRRTDDAKGEDDGKGSKTEMSDDVDESDEDESDDGKRDDDEADDDKLDEDDDDSDGGGNDGETETTDDNDDEVLAEDDDGQGSQMNAYDSRILWQGRTVSGAMTGYGSAGSRSFAWPGVQATFSVSGTKKVSMKYNVNFPKRGKAFTIPTFHVYVDGKCSKTFKANRKSDGTMAATTVVLASGLDSSKTHKIILYYVSDAFLLSHGHHLKPGAVTISKFSTSGGKFVNPLPERKRKLLVIGDSILAGWGVKSTKPGKKDCDLNQDISGAYGTRVCEYFGANCTSLVTTGIGVWHNCCDKGGVAAMPDMMTRTVPGEKNLTFDDSFFKPDGIVVGLGGDNDEDSDLYSKLKDQSKKKKYIATFKRHYQEFLVMLSKLHSMAPIFIITNSDRKGAKWVDSCVKVLRQNMKGVLAPIHMIDISFTKIDKVTKCKHPSYKGQQQLADRVIKKISSALKWGKSKRGINADQLECK